MKVLIAGGIKTQNIVDGLEKKFTSGGVDFIVVPFIEDIENIYYRGEYFDRALIIEQCWNRDFEIKDESVVRQKINDFASKAAQRDNTNINFIFLTQTKETAEIVSEEILSIQGESIIVVKQPKYSVSFFTTLVTRDIDKFPEDIIYREELPEITEVQEEKKEEKVDIPEVQEEKKEEKVDIPEYKLKNIDNIEDDLFNKNIYDDINLENTDMDKLDNIFDDDINLDNEQDYSDDAELFDEEDYEEDEINDIEVEFEPEEDEEQFDDFEIEDVTDDMNIEDTELYEEDINLNNEGHSKIEEPLEEPLEEQELFDSGDLFDDDDYEEVVEDNNKHEANFGEYTNEPIFIDEEEYDNSYTIEGKKGKVAKNSRTEMTNEQLRATLDAFASRGNSIVVTGCGGCGTSLVAYNLANTIVNLGYTCLLVDMDVEGRAQSYISKDNYDSIDADGSNIISAINSSSGINTHIAITRQGFHLLTLGMASELSPIEKIIQREKFSRFTTLVRNSHNFVIYDMPFKTATDFAQDITFTSDNIVLVVDSSNWGVGKTMLNVCNIESDEMQDSIFSRAQILFNRYRGLNKIFGKKVKSAIDIVKAIDSKVLELIGEDTGYYFEDMHICGVINEDQAVEEGWFSSKPYSETPQGQVIFTELLCNIVLKR